MKGIPKKSKVSSSRVIIIMAHLYPLRIDASTTKKKEDDDDNKNKSIRLIETLLLDPTCLPRPPSDYTTAEEAVEANVKALSDGLLSDFEVRALQPAGYRSGYYTGRMALLGLEELRGEVERQIRAAIWKLVDAGTGTSSVKASTASRGKRKSTSEGDTADTVGQKKSKIEERDKDDIEADKEGSVEGEVAAAAPAAESSSSAAPSGFQPEMTGEEQAKVSNDDQRELVARSASSSPAPKEEKEAEEVEQEKKDEKDGESIKSSNSRTEQGDDDSIDKSGLVKVHIRLRDRNLAVMDEFYIDPNLSADLPGADVLSVSKSLVKDLNLPEEMTLGIMTTILEQSRGLDVPADLVGAKPSGGSKTGPSRETPAAWTLD